MAVAVLALFVAMGGVGYAALKLPKNSVGSKQLKANAVNSSKVANGALLPGDFKAGQFPAGPQGARGPQGAQGLKGDNGGVGPRGPLTLSFDGQFGRDSTYHHIATVNGITLEIRCQPPSAFDVVILQVRPTVADAGFHGWGTRWAGFDVPAHANDSGTALSSTGDGTADLAVVAKASSGNGKYTTFHVNGIAAGGCNYHALIITQPPSGDGP